MSKWVSAANVLCSRRLAMRASLIWLLVLVFAVLTGGCGKGPDTTGPSEKVPPVVERVPPAAQEPTAVEKVPPAPEDKTIPASAAEEVFTNPML